MADEGIQIVEKRPKGAGSFREVRNWLQDAEKTVKDTGPIWDALIPLIRQGMRFEFSGANPNAWPGLSDKYLKWKISKGYPATIGILTGGLKQSLTDDAVIKKARKKLTWGANLSIPGYGGKTVLEYGWRFNIKRPIYKYTLGFIKRNVLQRAKRHILKKWRQTGVKK